MNSVLRVVMIPLGCFMTLSLGAILSGKEPLQTRKEPTGKEANPVALKGVNVADKNGVLYIDGLAANEVRFKNDDLEVKLNNFQKNPNKYDFNGISRDHSGICFFITIKNKTKKSVRLQMIDHGSDRADKIISGTSDSGGALSCAYTNGFFILNGVSYGLSNPYKNIEAFCEHKDDLVFFTVNLDAEKVKFNIDKIMGRKCDEFYVLLKNLKKTNKRFDEVNNFAKNKAP